MDRTTAAQSAAGDGAPVRCTLSALDRSQPNFVYVGRGGPALGLPKSEWNNPFKILTHRNPKHASIMRAKVIQRFREHLASSPLLLSQLSKLRGARLGCHCTLSQPCHADAIIQAYRDLCLPNRPPQPPDSHTTVSAPSGQLLAPFDDHPGVDPDDSTQAGRCVYYAIDSGMQSLTPAQHAHVRQHG